MSIHVCRSEYNGRMEFHLRYPGLTQKAAQGIADKINAGRLDGNPLILSTKDKKTLKSILQAAVNDSNLDSNQMIFVSNLLRQLR